MRRRAAFIFVALLLLNPVVAVAKGRHPHAITATASISVPATVAFGTSVTPQATYGDPLGPNESLWVKVTCISAGTVGLVGWAKPGQAIPIGPTPSWSGPSAECVADLIVWDALADNPPTVVAEAPFAVIP